MNKPNPKSSPRLAALDRLTLPPDYTLGTRTPEVPNAPLYHLADGLVVAIGQQTSRIMDLEHDDDLRIDFRFIEPLERIVLGWSMPGLESLIEPLLACDFIRPGPATPDPVIRQQLASLDAMFLESYRDSLSPRALVAYERLLDAHARRKRFFESVGQCPVLPETALRRALLVGDANDVGVKDVLCLGDDDLVSIALAALGHRVTVYDIDEFLLSFLREASRELSLPLEIAECDLRDPLRKTQRDRFDVILTDPMSNRDCFELFFSRALALLRPNGRLWTAAHPPTAGLLAEVADELGLPIERWLARHNRYYSHYIKLHWYESDWVELAKTEASRAKHPADDFCVPLNLYREDFFQRLPLYVGHIEKLENARMTRTFHLDMLFEAVELVTATPLGARAYFDAGPWTIARASLPDGFVALRADRTTNELTLIMSPFVPALEDALRSFALSLYKADAVDAAVLTTSATWEVRVR